MRRAPLPGHRWGLHGGPAGSPSAEHKHGHGHVQEASERGLAGMATRGAGPLEGGPWEGRDPGEGLVRDGGLSGQGPLRGWGLGRGGTLEPRPDPKSEVLRQGLGLGKPGVVWTQRSPAASGQRWEDPDGRLGTPAAADHCRGAKASGSKPGGPEGGAREQPCAGLDLPAAAE